VTADPLELDDRTTVRRTLAPPAAPPVIEPANADQAVMATDDAAVPAPPGGSGSEVSRPAGAQPGPPVQIHPLTVVLYVVGGVAAIFVFWKARVSGFYLREAPVLAIAGVVAAVTLTIAARLSRRR
jgi:hypothetical protein